MRKFYYLFIALIPLQGMTQEKPLVEVPFTDIAPIIDGNIDVMSWGAVPKVPIETDFTGEIPTVTAYWKALWDNDYIYVLLSVEDNDHWPAYESGGNWYEYDQPEVYLDLNAVLADGLGPGNGAAGHYQVLGRITDGGGAPTNLEESEFRPTGTFAYVVTGEDYVFEYAIDIARLANKDGVTMSAAELQALDSVGFDVTIIDQDEGMTTGRQRAVWQNDGTNGESYSNMDDAGTIKFVDELTEEEGILTKILGLNDQEIISKFSIYPNPVVKSQFTVNADVNKIIIRNTLGSEVLITQPKDGIVMVDRLSSGIYFVEAFDEHVFVGTTRMLKR